MSQVTLRDYQSRAVTEVLQKLDEGAAKRIMLVAPTGAGKTVMAAALVQNLVSRSLRVLFLAHRIELIEQAIARLGVPCGAIVAGSRLDVSTMPCIVASLQTLVRRDIPEVDVVIVDEAHHSSASSYRKIFDALPKAAIIGLTATPTRLDGRGLADIYQLMIEAASMSALIGEGSLVKPRVFSHPTQPDLQGVKITGGDYNEKQLEQVCNKANLRGDIVAHWQLRANNLATVCFAVSIAHSKALIDDFGRAGVTAVHVDGSMPRNEREASLKAIRSGEAMVLCNVGIVTEGWDMPQLRACILARPTASISLLMQMWGRVMRPAPGKIDAMVLDHAGNVLRHGLLPHHDVEWRGHFSGEAKKKGKRKLGKAGPALLSCPVCYAINAAGVENCADCGHVFERKSSEITVDADTHLEEVTDEVMALVKKHAEQPKYKPGIVERLEKDGVKFRKANGTLVYDDPLGIVGDQLTAAIGAQQKQILAWLGQNEPSNYMKRLNERLAGGKLPPKFLDVVKQQKGNLGKAVQVWKMQTGRFV